MIFISREETQLTHFHLAISLWYPQATGIHHYIPRCLFCTCECTCCSHELGCLTSKSPTLHALTASWCSPLRLTASREPMLWMFRWLLQHPWDPPDLAQPFPISHSWTFRTLWSSSGGVLKPGAALGHPVHTSVAKLSHWTLHKNQTGIDCGNVISCWPSLYPVTQRSRCSPREWKSRFKCLLQWIWIYLKWNGFTLGYIWSTDTWFRATKSLGWLGIWKSGMVLEYPESRYRHYPFFPDFCLDRGERHTAVQSV